MLKAKKPSELFMTPRFGYYGKIKKYKKDSQKTFFKVRVLKISLICLAFVLITATVYGVASVYFTNNNKGEEGIPATASTESESSQEESSQAESQEEELIFAVNSDNPLSDSYMPDLVEYQGIRINALMSSSLLTMVEKARNDGIDLKFSVGYVSKEQQDVLYNNRVEEMVKVESYSTIMARATAEFYVPRPLESEMQTGLCIEINAEEEGFEESGTYLWLVKNAAGFGFIFRYPPDKETVTDVEGDYRIIRYVGSEDAVIMRQLSMCLEEYIDYKSGR